MKNKLIYILSIFLVFCTFYDTTTIFAKDLALGYVNNNIKKHRLKVRKKPNTKSKTKFKLKENDAVTITVSSGKWYKIRSATGKKGWVKKKYIFITLFLSASDNVIKRKGKVVPKLNKSASINKVNKNTDD